MQEYRNNQGHTHGQERDKIFLIEPLLPTGKENRISSSELVRLAGCGSVRELQKRIAWEREQGAIICSGCGAGYWRPANAEFINQITALIKKWNVVDQGNEILKDFHGYR